MRRLHLFEFEDQPWFPDVLRDVMTAYISKLMDMTGMLDPLMPKVVEALDRTGAERIVDLCSGAGGPALTMARALEDRNTPIVCADKFPHARAADHVEQASGGRVSFDRRSVDAMDVRRDLTGLRTIFNAFHHFRPEQARRILADAHDAGQPIAIFETVDRRFANLAGIPAIPFFVLAVVPFLRPFRWLWIPLTYLLPIIPLLIMWDGLVSCLRIYQPPELRELVAGLDDFDWDIGRVPMEGAPIHATYIVGTPKS